MVPQTFNPTTMKTYTNTELNPLKSQTMDENVNGSQYNNPLMRVTNIRSKSAIDSIKNREITVDSISPKDSVGHK